MDITVLLATLLMALLAFLWPLFFVRTFGGYEELTPAGRKTLLLMEAIILLGLVLGVYGLVAPK